MEINEEEAKLCMDASKKRGWRNGSVLIQFWTKKQWFTNDERNNEVRKLFEEIGPELYQYMLDEVLTNDQIKKIDDWLTIRKFKPIFERWG
jgi:hypothetical protein